MPARTGSKQRTRLERYLYETGTSQGWLAQQLGVPKTTLAGWCSGHRRVTPEIASRICTVLYARGSRDVAVHSEYLIEGEHG